MRFFCYKYECNALGPKGKVLLCCHIVQVNFHHDLSHISKIKIKSIHVGGKLMSWERN
jgi:hypothetical protein